MRARLFSYCLAFLSALTGLSLLTGCSGGGSGSTGTPRTTTMAPSITTQPTSQRVYVGDTATFTVSATGSSPLTYSWTKNGTEVSKGSSSSYTTPTLTKADDGAEFAVSVSNSAGSVTSVIVKLAVSVKAIIITADPADESVVEGASAQFTVTATGTAPIAFQWTRDGKNISGATTATYSIPAVSLADNGAAFAVVATNDAGSVTSRSAKLIVTEAPPTITAQPADASPFVGETATFAVTASGTNLIYQWYKNGGTIPGATANTYKTGTNARADDGASYDVIVTNSVGSVTSNKAVVHVGPFATKYTTQKGVQLNMYAWPGQRNAFLTQVDTLDPVTMRKIVNAADSAYNYYAKAVGKEPGLFFNYNGLATIANTGVGGVDLCGAGCTYIGATGMEIDNNTMADLYSRIQKDDYNWVIFYEFGRSFWLFHDQLEYRGADDSSCEVTGFAVYMGIHTLQALNYQSDYGTGIDGNTNPMQSELADLDQYASDSSLNFQNTFLVNKYSGPGGCSVLWAGVVERLRQTYGGEAFVQSLFKEALKRPLAYTTQDAVDNFVLAASAAAGKNLTQTFGVTWKWPISSSAINEAQDKWGAPE